MANQGVPTADLRSSPRFVPPERLSIFLADTGAPVVHGDVRNLSESGACVVTDAAVSDGPVTLNVRNGYSFLFKARARLVWSEPTHAAGDRTQGLSFTDVTPFTQKLIRRMRAPKPMLDVPSDPAIDRRQLDADADSDPDLQVWLRDEDPFDALEDDAFHPALLEPSESVCPSELSGNLGYFEIADILQMLEASRATGVLHIDGPLSGEIHVIDGGIGRCVADGLPEADAAFRLVIARDGTFRFLPAAIDNESGVRTTTQLLLDAQLRLDNERRG